VGDANWRLLRDGVDAVLAVDFGGAGRAAAGFAELAPKLDTACAVWELGFLHGGPASPQELVHGWANEVRRRSLAVRAVFGYCAGSALACLLADALGSPPVTVLFDPEVVSGPVLVHEFLTGVGTLAEDIDTDLLPASAARARRLAAECPDDLEKLAALLHQEYRGVARSAFDELGLDASLSSEITARFGSYLKYLVTSARADLSGSLSAPLAICSVDHQPIFRPLAERHWFPVPRAGLLADPGVATTVSTWIA
jgi:hypothetical protein